MVRGGLTRIPATMARIRELGRHRTVRRFDGPPEPETTLEGRPVLLFSSNNYLGLATHPDVVAAAQEATRRHGTGSGGSRLLSGSTALHAELETALARLKGTQDAVLFGTGYQANLGAVTALAGPGDLVASDRLNHASLIDACRMSRATTQVYAHGDPVAARQSLTQARPSAPQEGPAASGHERHRLLVTDGVFSMDGDEAPLAALADIAEAEQAALVVDDAHGLGVLGGGRGTAHEQRVPARRVDVHVGTLSKALASQGGFVAGTSELCDHVRNTARPFIFSTAPPPACVAAALAALQVMDREPHRVARLLANARRLRDGLSGAAGLDRPAGVTGPPGHAGFAGPGLQVLPGRAAIVPVVVGRDADAVAWRDALEARGIHVAAVRPPTVPEGSCRLRFTAMATHTDDHLSRCIEAFAEVAQAMAAAGGTGRGGHDGPRMAHGLANGDANGRVSAG